MRLVLDTNAAVSGLLWHGNPGKLIDAAQAASLVLYASAPLLAELHGVLGRDKFAKNLQVRGLTPTQIFEGYAALTAVVVPAIHPASYHRRSRRRRGARVCRRREGRSRSFPGPTSGEAGSVRRYSHRRAGRSGGGSWPVMLSVSNAVGVDVGAPRRAGDQRRKIIAIAAHAVADRRYRVDAVGINERLLANRLPGCSAKELVDELLTRTVGIVAFDFPFSIPDALLRDEKFAVNAAYKHACSSAGARSTRSSPSGCSLVTCRMAIDGYLLVKGSEGAIWGCRGSGAGADVMRHKRIKPGQRVDVRLTPQERDLIL